MQRARSSGQELGAGDCICSRSDRDARAAAAPARLRASCAPLSHRKRSVSRLVEATISQLEVPAEYYQKTTVVADRPPLRPIRRVSTRSSRDLRGVSRVLMRPTTPSDLLVVQLLLAAQLPGAASCAGPHDCNMAGRCVGQKCECATGFAGASCDTLVMESYHCGQGGLCLANGSTTWGGSVVRADDGSFHMYAAMMTANRTMQAWLTNSVVLHAIAPSGHPQGPYTPAGVALAPRPKPNFDSVMIHCPDVVRAPDGTFAIFYDGSSTPPGQVVDRAAGASGLNPIILRQNIGLATATSPFGPWTRRNTPILEPSGVNGTWDQLFVTNPAAYIFPNASALLIYKSGRAVGWPSMYMGVAFADHYTGPYRRLTPTKPLVIRKQSDDCEDPDIYFDHDYGVFRMVLHCGCGTQMLWSATGVDWELGGPVQASGWCTGFNYTDGTVGRLVTRQRPHFVLDKGGRATHLTTGVNRPDDVGMGHTWTMAAKLL